MSYELSHMMLQKYSPRLLSGAYTRSSGYHEMVSLTLYFCDIHAACTVPNPTLPHLTADALLRSGYCSTVQGSGIPSQQVYSQHCKPYN